MLTWIVAHSEALCNFLLPLLVGFSEAQQRHALNFIEALLVCPAKHKTLAALTRLLRLPHADEYALADFFRRSPWDANAVQHALTLFVLRTVAQIQQRSGWRLLFLSVDDALCPKDASTWALQAVTWFFDHVIPRRQWKGCTRASRYVAVHLQLGPVQFALAWRLYLRRTQVTRLNRQRRGTTLPRLTYQSLPTLVQALLAEVAPHLPKGCRVYVLFDAWYDSRELQQTIHAYGWHWIGAARASSKLSRYALGQWWTHLGAQHLTRVTLRSARRSHTYLTRRVSGRLRRYPDEVVAIISKRGRRDRHPAYFLCSDCSLSTRTILKYYGRRWQAEVDNWFLKERFGLADYRLQSVEAIQRWHALVFAAYIFIQYQRVQPLLPKGGTGKQTAAKLKTPVALKPLGAILVAHQQGHARLSVCHIAALVRQGWSDQRLLAALFPT